MELSLPGTRPTQKRHPRAQEEHLLTMVSAVGVTEKPGVEVDKTCFPRKKKVTLTRTKTAPFSHPEEGPSSSLFPSLAA